MKLINKQIITIIFSLVFSVQALKAQQNGFGPHGGRLKSVGNYKIELFGCDNYIEVYVFDRDTKTISSKNINGTVEFFYSGQATLSYPLTHYGIDGFTAKIPVNTFLYSKLSLNINGEFIITEKFENECSINANKTN